MKTRIVIALLFGASFCIHFRAAAADPAESLERFRKACGDLGLPSDKILVGFASSMEKILPRAMPFEVRPARAVELSLARNEKESFQVAVMGADGPCAKWR